ncbi:MAG: restriction endonuclease subunit S, partial [Lentisphaeria bacterium]|nr:restriction endonuclease subunit S [Lentisphaeria bacterium]
VKTGDVIISRMNTAELVGATAYVWQVAANTFLPDRLWKAIIKDDVNPIFLWRLLIHPSVKKRIRGIAGGTSGSMKNISKSGLLKISVPNVDYPLQNEFASFIEHLDKSKVVVQNGREHLKKLFAEVYCNEEL